MEFRLLGPVECESRTGVVRLGRFQERCLVGVLAAESGRIVQLDRLVELLWDGDPPGRARSIVQTHVSRLRARLGADVLLTRGQGYLLEVDEDAVDLHRFRRLLDQARATPDPHRRAELLRTALALWRGPPFADAATGRIREQLCAGLDELWITAVEDRAEADLERGLHRELVIELTDLVARHPLRERLIGLLMLARYRSGQQAKALDTYREARHALIDDLGIEPGAQLRRLEQAILNQDPALDLGGPARPDTHPVPHREPGTWRGQRSHLTSIIGRERELGELTWLLADHRLVTVVGAGGVGKTTLAMHAAEALWAAEGRSVTVVPLASLRGREEIVLAVGSLLGVVGATVDEVLAGVARSLHGRPHMLLLDNCEHLIEPCADVVRQLLSTTPRLVILATSRQPIGLPEETAWRLEPLRVPDDDAAADAGVPAVALFLRRARERRAGFTPTADELAFIARICRRVDGLPFALELAAGRLRSLTVQQLADQLDHGFELLWDGRVPTIAADPRHGTLATTIDWSYRLLTPDEQRLLSRISVFRDSFTQEAAQRVCGGDPLTPQQVPAALAALIDRSLLQQFESDHGRRYRLLQVVRDYAEKHLAELGEHQTMADRHFGHWLDRARTIFGNPVLEQQITAWATLGPEMDNLRAALQHGYATDPTAAIELTAHTFDFWQVHGAHLAEGERWIAAAWPRVATCPPQLQCVLRYHKAALEMNRDDYVSTLDLLRQSLPDLRAHHPMPYLDGLASAVRAEVRILDPAALAHARSVYRDLRTSPDRHTRVLALVMLTEALIAWGRYAEAAEACAHDAPDPDDLTTTNAVRWYTAVCLAELGCGRFDSAAAAETRLRDLLRRPGNIVHLATPARAIALHALCALPPTESADVLAGLVAEITGRYTPTLSSAYRFEILQAETERRTGRPDRARIRLAHVLPGVLHSGAITNYGDLMPAVLTTALVAADLGDRHGGHDLARSWDRVRRRAGLPVMLGFAAQASDAFGLDPEPSPALSYEWDEPMLRNLVERAAHWCTVADQARVASC